MVILLILLQNHCFDGIVEFPL